jgi:replicative superfamily II helicase
MSSTFNPWIDDDQNEESFYSQQPSQYSTNANTTSSNYSYPPSTTTTPCPNNKYLPPNHKNNNTTTTTTITTNHQSPTTQLLTTSMLLSKLTPIQRRTLPTIPNSMQHDVLPIILQTNENIIISAPTGAGKTVIFDGAILNEILKFNQMNKAKKINIVYIAPSRALCQLQALGFTSRFTDLGICVRVITGDDDLPSLVEKRKEQGRVGTLTVTTPEKFEIMNRRNNYYSYPVLIPNLLLIDEIHHVGETNRGATLEVAITRVLRSPSPPRIVAVSATVPNVQDIANWIHGRAMVFNQRPCPLTVHVMGFHRPQQKSEFLFEKDLDRAVPEVLRTHSNGRPTLIFVSSRKNAEELATRLADLFHTLPYCESSQQPNQQKKLSYGVLPHKLTNVKDVNLAKILRIGVGWHTAALEASDRELVEHEFLQCKLGIIVCTSTLAVGVDLPAYCVVIKSTRAYRGPSVGFQTLERSTLIQMCGRAGRPGSDDIQGVAVIMTEQGTESIFEDLASGLVKIESSLGKNLTLAKEALNVEICNGNISTEQEAERWWSCTLACQQQQQQQSASNTSMDNLIQQYITSLVELGCVTKCYEQPLSSSNSSTTQALVVVLKPTSTGKLASSHHLSLNTVKLFSEYATQIPISSQVGYDGILEILHLLCSSQEFNSMEPRRDQKKFLNMISWTLGKFKSLKSQRVMTCKDKTLQLLQCVLGGIPISEVQLRQESTSVMEHAPRLARALTKLLADAGNPRVVESAALSRFLELKTWDELLQLDGVGIKTKEKMETTLNIHSLKDITDLMEKKRISVQNNGLLPVKAIHHVMNLMSEGKKIPMINMLSDGSVSIRVDLGGGNNNNNNMEKKFYLAAISEYPTPKLLGFTENMSTLIIPGSLLTNQYQQQYQRQRQGNNFSVGKNGGGRIVVWVINRQALGIDVCVLVDFLIGSNSSNIPGHHVQVIEGDPWSSETLQVMASSSLSSGTSSTTELAHNNDMEGNTNNINKGKLNDTISAGNKAKKVSSTTTTTNTIHVLKPKQENTRRRQGFDQSIPIATTATTITKKKLQMLDYQYDELDNIMDNNNNTTSKSLDNRVGMNNNIGMMSSQYSSSSSKFFPSNNGGGNNNNIQQKKNSLLLVNDGNDYLNYGLRQQQQQSQIFPVKSIVGNNTISTTAAIGSTSTVIAAVGGGGGGAKSVYNNINMNNTTTSKGFEDLFF